MTEIKTKPFDRLEVGKTYVDRDGDTHRIEKYIKGSLWPYKNSLGYAWTSKGYWTDGSGDEDLDLIAEVIDKPVYRVKAGSEALYHDPRVTMEQVGDLMAQDGEFSPGLGRFSPEQYRAALDDFIHGGDSKDTRDVIKDALRVMGGV